MAIPDCDEASQPRFGHHFYKASSRQFVQFVSIFLSFSAAAGWRLLPASNAVEPACSANEPTGNATLLAGCLNEPTSNATLLASCNNELACIVVFHVSFASELASNAAWQAGFVFLLACNAALLASFIPELACIVALQACFVRELASNAAILASNASLRVLEMSRPDTSVSKIKTLPAWWRFGRRPLDFSIFDGHPSANRRKCLTQSTDENDA